MNIDLVEHPDRIDDYLADVEGMMRKVTEGAGMLGAISSRLEMQLDFGKVLSDSIDRGVGRLVDADLDETSTR